MWSWMWSRTQSEGSDFRLSHTRQGSQGSDLLYLHKDHVRSKHYPSKYGSLLLPVLSEPVCGRSHQNRMFPSDWSISVHTRYLWYCHLRWLIFLPYPYPGHLRKVVRWSSRCQSTLWWQNDGHIPEPGRAILLYQVCTMVCFRLHQKAWSGQCNHTWYSDLHFRKQWHCHMLPDQVQLNLRWIPVPL